MDINVTGSFLVCKHAIPAMIAAGGGSIVLMASQMSHVASSRQLGLLHDQGRAAAARQRDRARLRRPGDPGEYLVPGGIATHRQLLRFPDMETAHRQWGARHPMGRLGKPDEVARAALFLASDDSSFMTGADLLIDGGYVAW